jgi:hypothetical protein
MATWSNTTKNTSVFAKQEKSDIPYEEFSFLIDDTYSLLIDTTYNLLIQPFFDGTVWTNEAKN